MRMVIATYAHLVILLFVVLRIEQHTEYSASIFSSRGASCDTIRVPSNGI
jgi:hypothetical protein